LVKEAGRIRILNNYHNYEDAYLLLIIVNFCYIL
jgi:hypothetical protein